jgi:hypothetical protein
MKGAPQSDSSLKKYGGFQQVHYLKVLKQQGASYA